MREIRPVDWRFKQAMYEAGFSQRKLAKAVGINNTLLSMYTRGRYNLTAAEKEKIAQVLNLTVGEVFTY